MLSCKKKAMVEFIGSPGWQPTVLLFNQINAKEHYWLTDPFHVRAPFRHLH